MGIIWSTMKVGEGSSKEVTTVVIGEDQVYFNKAPSTSTSTIAIGEDPVCSTYEVCDGKTTSMPVTVADLLPFKDKITVFEPAPSDNEAWKAISTIKDSNDSVLEPAPSDEEVQEAISLIKEVLEPQISETGISSMITSSDSVTSEDKQLELINAQPQSSIVQLNPDLPAAIALCCNIENCRPSVKKMIVRAAKDENIWHAFMNSESVVEFMTGDADIQQLLQTHVVNGSAVGNVKEDGDQGSAVVDKNMYFKLIIDKARETVLEVVSKAFDSMEKVFLPHEQQSHQKSKQSCFDPKYQEGSSTSEKIFDTVEHIMRTPFLATLLINTVVFVYRIIRVSLKSDHSHDKWL